MDYIDIDEFPLIGSGDSGSVYRIDKNRCIKICEEIEDMQMEYQVLMHAKGYPQFPKVYECKENYMIREFIDGQNIKTYIKENEFDNNLAMELTELIKVFIKLKFKRIDIKMNEVFVTEDHKIKIIDTTHYLYQQASYPRKMLKSLENLGCLDLYMDFLKKDYPEFYNAWS